MIIVLKHGCRSGVGGSIQLVMGYQKKAIELSFYPVRSLLIWLRRMRVITQGGRLLYYSRTSRSWGMHRAPKCWLTSFISLLKGNADGREVRRGYRGQRGLWWWRCLILFTTDIVFVVEMKLKVKSLVYVCRAQHTCGLYQIRFHTPKFPLAPPWALH